MNPSASGWIDKFGYDVKDNLEVFSDFRDLYGGLKTSGFVYGLNIKVPRFIVPEHTLSEDEKAKINLLTALFFTFKLERSSSDFDDFLQTIFQFYKELNISNISFLNKILASSKTSNQLEKLIDSRVYLDDNVFSKTFNRIITNSLLFIDVLTFKYYLKGGKNLRDYAQTIEYLTINVTSHALNSKEKNKKDERLAQLFTSSMTFIDGEKQKFDGSYRDQIMNNPAIWENQYFLDVACLTVWEDKTLEYKESEFIFGIGKDLGFEKSEISRSLEEITSFFEKNSSNIPFLEDPNMAIQFYDSMAKVVNKLILRNSKRLQKELSESKELMQLLSKSTVKDLSSEEKKKVQNQLIDIFKSIPSLAIFLLPGGAVLLPIFIKLIPKLLPSAFDDNRVGKKS
ncbi:LETM1-related biofilm-associated protein [Eudoraea adriatica]|uniref:LETM1-related biofilm-associated protein n=1 Tax=Eudoraea adriatica TaxID=446681 RepID=UPI00037859AC|nr:LETM1-related biofilm-associated protein [Eudoraea adriatica]